ncbi:MAG TPA: UPF0182 family protein [Polyangiaceae bacterium]|nr:UPF0182 family protein [Polyangiaceae bacterium]
MYIALLFTLLALGATLLLRGLSRGRRQIAVPGALLLAGTLAFYAFLSFWGELLWFEELGQARRFWVVLFAASGTAAAGAVAAGSVVWLVTRPLRRAAPRARRAGVAFAAALGLLWGGAAWDLALQWLYAVDAGVREPVFGLDAGFYLFSLPFYDALYGLALVSAAVALALASWVAFGNFSLVSRLRRSATLMAAGPRERADAPASAPRTARKTRALEAEAEGQRGLYAAAAAFALALCFGRVLSMYHLLYSSAGVVRGPGWTDAHVRLPANVVLAAALALAALALLVPGTRRALESRLGGPRRREAGASGGPGATSAIGALALGITALWALGLVALPALFQWLRVTPNELALERPYLEHSIAFTRRGFALDRVESRQFDPKGRVTEELVERSEHVLSEVRLWDPQALDQVLEQFQEIRLYYELTGVDIDRYQLGPNYRQVMIAPREMEPRNLPAESQTFVNRHFKYTHGYGVAMAPVSDFTPDGLPMLVVRDMPPVSEHPAVVMTRPEIYYGERADHYVVVNSRAAEFDYPSGAENVYARYAGAGGVELRGFFRKLVYGWKLGGTRLLFSDYPTDESRIMFRRNVRERVATLAPFLELDGDPYVVLVGGRLKWVIDAYTTSNYYPYSEPFFDREGVPSQSPEGAPGRPPGLAVPVRRPRLNYVRNAVKAVVDAYDGSAALYVYEPDDPIIRVWSRVFPELLRPKSEMPAELRAHVRYPEEMLHLQGLVYAKYHMTDPEVFYNQEDLWVRATEKHYGDVKPVAPYYVMWQPPGSGRAEFVTMQPYTPKNRQVLIGWLAGMCDPDNYGRLLAYRFPKDKWVLGPQQVDTKIDQDAELSGQLTLWNQLGKRVIRGNVLAIPIDETILYVEPIYLQAETAAYPELRMVVVMNGEAMSFAPSFRGALEGLLGPGERRPAGEGRAEGGAPRAEPGPQTFERAQRHFDAYVRLTGEGRFAEAAAELEGLGEVLAGRGREPRDLPNR